MSSGMSFLPQRVGNHGSRRNTTLDRRAMIHDTSSESGQSETNTLTYAPKVSTFCSIENLAAYNSFNFCQRNLRN